MPFHRRSWLLAITLLAGCGARSSLFVDDGAAGAGAAGGGSGSTGGETGASCAGKAWTIAFGEYTTSAGTTSVRQLTTGPDGSILAFGTFTGSISLGGQTIEAQGPDDYFLVMLDECGSPRWIKRIGDELGQAGTGGDAVLDAEGNVLFTGSAVGPVDLGAGPMEGNGMSDVLVAKLDPDGGLLWARRWSGDKGQRGARILVAPGGEVIVTGSFSGEMSVDGEPVVSSPDGDDPFIARLSPDGEQAASVFTFPGASPPYLSAVTLGPGGDLFFAAEVVNGLGLPPTPTEPPSGVALVRLSGAAAEILGVFTGESLQLSRLHIGAEGMFVVGSSLGKVVYDAANGESAGFYQEGAFVYRIGDGPGELLAKKIDEAVVIGDSYAAGDLYLAGAFAGDADILGQKGATPGGAFLLRATPDLQGAYLKVSSGEGVQHCTSLAPAASGAMVLGGNFSGTLDFGSGPVESKGALNQWTRAFVAKVFED